MIGLLQGFSGGILGFYLLEPEPELRIAGFDGLIAVTTTLVAIKSYGFTSKTLSSFIAVFIRAFAFAAVVAAVYNYIVASKSGMKTFYSLSELQRLRIKLIPDIPKMTSLA
ncbi:MAG: hypothetical protein ACFB14_14465 [Leptolyngbyaceae cyanobacterium]